MSNARRLIIALIVGFLVLSLASWLPTPEAKDVVRFLLNALLCWFLWRGARWARWVLGVLAAVAFIVAGISVLRMPFQIEATVILTAMGLFYGFAAFVLLSGKWIRSHFGGGTPNNLLQPIAREDARSG
jgi:hypothetical protein